MLLAGCLAKANFHGLATHPPEVPTEVLSKIRGRISCHGYLQCVLESCKGQVLRFRDSWVWLGVSKCPDRGNTLMDALPAWLYTR